MLLDHTYIHKSRVSFQIQESRAEHTERYIEKTITISPLLLTYFRFEETKRMTIVAYGN